MGVKIKGKNISWKTIIIIGSIVTFIVLLVVANNYQKRKEEASAEAEAIATTVPVATLSRAELQQQSYESAWGKAPEGFRWTRRGELEALSDDSLPAEDVAYSYLRALSTLDLGTAEKYASVSVALDTYEGYYDVQSSSSYNTQFQRKLFKEALLSIEIDKARDKAVFADGNTIITFEITMLDLTDKDFWKPDAEEIYSDLSVYLASESDSTKAQQYIYDRILAFYQSGNAKKRTVQIDLVMDKISGGGWLVTDDADLSMACEYRNGTSVYEYIMDCYSDWVRERQRMEQ